MKTPIFEIFLNFFQIKNIELPTVLYTPHETRSGCAFYTSQNFFEKLYLLIEMKLLCSALALALAERVDYSGYKVGFVTVVTVPHSNNDLGFPY